MNALNCYRIFDLLLASELLLPELPTATSSAPDLQVEFSHAPLPAMSRRQWDHHWRDPQGNTSLSLAKSESGFLLRSPQVADFRIDHDCKRIDIVAEAATAKSAIRHLLIDQVLPRVVAQRGRPVLHASAVSLNQSAVAFAGETGAGKSTIATWCHQSGHTLLTDDSLVLAAGPAQAQIIPAYAGARLWDDSPVLERLSTAELRRLDQYSDKLRLDLAHSNSQHATPLAALLVLAPGTPAEGTAVELVPLTGAEALMALIQHSFQLDLTDSESSSAQLRSLGEIINAGLRLFRLRYPHTPGALAEVEETVRSLSAATGDRICVES